MLNLKPPYKTFPNIVTPKRKENKRERGKPSGVALALFLTKLIPHLKQKMTKRGTTEKHFILVCSYLCMKIVTTIWGFSSHQSTRSVWDAITSLNTLLTHIHSCQDRLFLVFSFLLSLMDNVSLFFFVLSLFLCFQLCHQSCTVSPLLQFRPPVSIPRCLHFLISPFLYNYQFLFKHYWFYCNILFVVPLLVLPFIYYLIFFVFLVAITAF